MSSATAAAAAPALPLTARRLGYGGLVPFVAAALLVWIVHDDVRPHVAYALSAWAAVVVALLGGVHWGFAFRHPEPPTLLLGWGAAAMVAAWIAVLMPPGAGLVIHGGMLLGSYAMDRRLYPAHGAAHWLTLRFRLSTLAALSCFIGAAGA